MKATKRIFPLSDFSDEDCTPNNRVTSSGGGVKVSKSSSSQHQEQSQEKRELATLKEESIGGRGEPSSMVPKQPIAKKQKTDDLTFAMKFNATPASAIRENPNTLIDWETLEPRWYGEKQDWQKFCGDFISDLRLSENEHYFHMFYLPVDARRLNLSDYWDIVKTPMDLQTIEMKLEYNQYIEPAEFAADMHLMIDNFCKYNAEEDWKLHSYALALKKLFEEYWKLCPNHQFRQETSDGIDRRFSTSAREELGARLSYFPEDHVHTICRIIQIAQYDADQDVMSLRSLSDNGLDFSETPDDVIQEVLHYVSRVNERAVDKIEVAITKRQLEDKAKASGIVRYDDTSRWIPKNALKKIVDENALPPDYASRLSTSFRDASSSSISKPEDSMSVSKPSPILIDITTPPHTTPEKKMPSIKAPGSSTSPKVPTQAVKISEIPVERSLQDNSKVIKKKLSPNARYELSIRMSSLPENHMYSCLRIIQIGQHEADEDVVSLRSLCDNEIDFTEISDDIIQELLEYISAVDSYEAKVLKIMKNLKEKAKSYGKNHYGDVISDREETDTERPSRLVAEENIPTRSTLSTANSDDTTDDAMDRDASGITGNYSDEEEDEEVFDQPSSSTRTPVARVKSRAQRRQSMVAPFNPIPPEESDQLYWDDQGAATIKCENCDSMFRSFTDKSRHCRDQHR